MVIAAHNEEKVIEEKIRNTFDLEFPRKNLEILIGSDASTDRHQRHRGQYAPDVKLFAFNQRGGKAAVLNQLVPRAQGDILVFCDANTMLLPQRPAEAAGPLRGPEGGLRLRPPHPA